MSNSWAAVALVRSRRFSSSTAKQLMLLLALRVDEQWSCFIGQRRLAAEAQCTDRTVRALEAEFEAAGLIRREKRYAGHRGRTSDRIYLVRHAIQALPPIDADLADLASARQLGLPEADDQPPEDGADLAAAPDRAAGSLLPGNYQRRNSRNVARQTDHEVASADAPLDIWTGARAVPVPDLRFTCGVCRQPFDVEVNRSTHSTAYRLTDTGETMCASCAVECGAVTSEYGPVSARSTSLFDRGRWVPHDPRRPETFQWLGDDPPIDRSERFALPIPNGLPFSCGNCGRTMHPSPDGVEARGTLEVFWVDAEDDDPGWWGAGATCKRCLRSGAA